MAYLGLALLVGFFALSFNVKSDLESITSLRTSSPLEGEEFEAYQALEDIPHELPAIFGFFLIVAVIGAGFHYVYFHLKNHEQAIISETTPKDDIEVPFDFANCMKFPPQVQQQMIPVEVAAPQMAPIEIASEALPIQVVEPSNEPKTEVFYFEGQYFTPEATQ